MTLHHTPSAYKQPAVGGGLSQGVNFRATEVYVSEDPPGTTWGGLIPVFSYPSQAIKDGLGNQDFNAGWVAQDPRGGTRDRSLTNDPRLAGTVFGYFDTQSDWRIDVTGSVGWSAAFGDPSSATGIWLDVYDGNPVDIPAAPLIVSYRRLTTSTPANSFLAADDVVYTEANWVIADAAKSNWRTDSFSNYMYFRWNDGAPVDFTIHGVSHINVEYTP